MKKLMLIMAGALVSLSACSKSADEPVAQQQQNQAGELVTINVSFEGEREPIQVVNQEGRGLDLKTDVQDNLIKNITVDGSGEVDGVIYLYRPGFDGTTANVNGIARQVKFKVNGNKISYRGSIPTRIQRGYLPFTTMDVYVGGRIKRQTIEPDNQKDPRGGSIEYYPSIGCIPTQEGMNLSQFNPIFYSKGMPVTVGKSGQTQDYYSTGHKLKLFGEFISCRVRLARAGGASIQARYNGFLLRGFGSEGMVIEAPSKANGGRPTFGKVMASATRTPDKSIFIGLGKTYYVWGDQKAPSIYSNAGTNAQAPRTDDAYTFYLFTNVEPQGGIRPAYNRSTAIFTPARNWGAPYWGASDSQPYTSKSANWGKFHNLIVALQ